MRIAVLSPFVDRRHGTERCIAEQIERFAAEPGAEVHLYSQRVEDVAGVVAYPAAISPGRILWHRVGAVPGPHLVSFVWWFFGNAAQRFIDRYWSGLKFDLIYSAGINALDANVISVHVIFRELSRRLRTARYASNSVWTRLHRSLYYALIGFLEGRIYRRRDVSLIAPSMASSRSLRQFFRREDVRTIRHGVDCEAFHPSVVAARREAARASLQLRPSDFCLLLIGNDWENKGLRSVLQAMSECSDVPFALVLAGSDDPNVYAECIGTLKLKGKVKFRGHSADVMQFYSAADVYVGASLEDAYGLPILEAMACGLPVVASRCAGASEIITDKVDGVILGDPESHRELATILRLLHSNPDLCGRLSRQAHLTAQQYTWQRNASEGWKVFEEIAARRK